MTKLKDIIKNLDKPLFIITSNSFCSRTYYDIFC